METAMVNGRLCRAPQGDSYVQCSFNQHHIILRSKLASHIVKCKKNYPRHNKIQCPFDATEYIDRDKLQCHLVVCKSRRSLVADKYDHVDLKARDSVGKVYNPSFCQAYDHLGDESWDDPLDNNALDDSDFPDIDEVFILNSIDKGNSANNSTPSGMGRGAFLLQVYQDYKQKQGLSKTRLSTTNTKENITDNRFEDA